MSPLIVFVSLLLPALVGFITRTTKDSDVRFWKSVCVCMVVGTIVNFIEQNGIYTGKTLLEIANSITASIMLMVGLVKVSYQAIWDNKVVSKMLPDEIAKDTETPLKALGLDPISKK